MARMNQEQLLEMLKRKQGKRSLREFAQEIGITPAYLCDIYKGRRQGGAKLLRYFGMEKTVTVTSEYQKA
jgi:hypothetical protein